MLTRAREAYIAIRKPIRWAAKRIRVDYAHGLAEPDLVVVVVVVGDRIRTVGCDGFYSHL